MTRNNVKKTTSQNNNDRTSNINLKNNNDRMSNINLKNKNISDDEEEGYLPLKYPIRGSQKKCDEKIKKFKINSEDKKEASCSNSKVCEKCSKNITQNQNYLQCNDICKRFYHLKCSKSNTKLIDNNLIEMKEEWICEKCKVKYTGNLENYIKDIQKSINFISEKYDIIYEENKNFLKTLMEISKNQEELKKENISLKKHVENLQKEITNIEQKNDVKSQISIKNNIEIKGVPENPNIDDKEITKKILKQIGINTEKEDIIEIKRTESKNENIIKIKLKNEDIKKKILEKSKQYFRNNGKLTTYELNLKGNQNIIYVNEELTPKTKYLFGKTKELKKNSFKFIWIKNGKIFVRKNEEERIIHINTEETLKQLINLNNC